MTRQLQGKNVMVTGACGSIGGELVKQLVEHGGIASLVGLDNNESALFHMERLYAGRDNVRFYLGDIRDRRKLVQRMKSVDVVFHSAAYKHVILCERSPYEAVMTNVIGVQNVISAAEETGVGRLVFMSSDKAVNPTSVMGTSKLMGERLVTAASNRLRDQGSIYHSVRFGNVLGSRGSVIPIFREQIARGGPVTLTDPAMTRFIMSVRQAVELIIGSMAEAQGGEVFITKMPAIRIADLAQVMIRELAPRHGHDPGQIAVEEIGFKAGEKIYEELMSEEETRRSLELECYYVVLPAWDPYNRELQFGYRDLVSRRVETAFNSASARPLDQGELTEFIRRSGLLEPASGPETG